MFFDIVGAQCLKFVSFDKRKESTNVVASEQMLPETASQTHNAIERKRGVIWPALLDLHDALALMLAYLPSNFR